MTKKSYSNLCIHDTIDTAIQLLCEEGGRCTPTDVLRFGLLDESNTTRKMVLERALHMKYSIKSSGKGYVIFDEYFGDESWIDNLAL